MTVVSTVTVTFFLTNDAETNMMAYSKFCLLLEYTSPHKIKYFLDYHNEKKEKKKINTSIIISCKDFVQNLSFKIGKKYFHRLENEMKRIHSFQARARTEIKKSSFRGTQRRQRPSRLNIMANSRFSFVKNQQLNKSCPVTLDHTEWS